MVLRQSQFSTGSQYSTGGLMPLLAGLFQQGTRPEHFHGRPWPLMAAHGRSWPLVAAHGRSWPETYPAHFRQLRSIDSWDLSLLLPPYRPNSMQRVLLCVQVYTSLQALRCPVFSSLVAMCICVLINGHGARPGLFRPYWGASHPLELQQQQPLTQGPGGKYPE